ncbi:MAG: RluA family pseudouridine synthase [Bacteroidetes bacterium]|jgi:23S rRNA pseudouridine1911/1915/1917 synthase|nr:RluA family pseudouridine synthase [Bacteroidota bacterium]
MAEEEEDFNEQSELYEHYRFVADKGQGFLRIDKFLYNKLEDVSRNKIQQVANDGNIRANNIPVKPNYKVKPHDVITIFLPYPQREVELIPQDIPIQIVYEDDQILIVNKEPGMVVHPGHGNYTGTLVNALMHHLKDEPLFKQGLVRPGLVHRIDKNTSGLLVIAKTEEALNNLAMQFFERTTQREYVALVWGDMKEDSGTITGNIARDLKDRMKMAFFKNPDQGKHAVTHYQVLERLGYVNLISCKLETGRTHQIRVHLEYIGHPLFNDERYGGDRILKGTTFSKYKQFVNNCFHVLPRHALHAKSLGFMHPTTQKEMLFDSELPSDMVEALEKWRRYTAARNDIND